MIVVVFAVFALVLLIPWDDIVDDGWEDENGFHRGRKP